LNPSSGRVFAATPLLHGYTETGRGFLHACKFRAGHTTVPDEWLEWAWGWGAWVFKRISNECCVWSRALVDERGDRALWSSTL